MASKFDTAIPDLIRVVTARPEFAGLQRACVVRDLSGKLRLVLDGVPRQSVREIENAVGAELKEWFVKPAIGTQSESAAESRLAKELLSRAASTWPSGWPTSVEDPVSGQVTEIDHTIWVGYQRVLTKQSWLDDAPGTEIWPLQEGNPCVVAFYSFKGGVGRSTLLGIVAWTLAARGKNVVCLDLDLEAPGLDGLLGEAGGESMLDFLLNHAATNKLPDAEPVLPVRIHGHTVQFMGAGPMDWSYIEKLARLDYLGVSSASESPVALALRTLLERIKGQHKPDYILLDCRAGLHDLGGLSLTDFSHVDVLVGRDTPQGRKGLGLVLKVLAKRRLPKSQRIVIAQTFVPVSADAAKESLERFKDEMYRACEASVYEGITDAPAVEDKDVAHFPVAIPERDEIARAQKLDSISLATLQGDEFTALTSRVEALSAPDAE